MNVHELANSLFDFIDPQEQAEAVARVVPILTAALVQARAEERAKVVEWLYQQEAVILCLQAEARSPRSRDDLGKLARARSVCAQAIEKGAHHG